MRADLHTHSLASDGTDLPAEVVRKAARAGLDVLALTDHDSTSGWEPAAGAALEAGITLVRGIEISTRHRGRSVHLLAYLPDPTHEPLVALLAGIVDGRNERMPGIVKALQDHGLQISEDDVRREAGATAASGRPHVADALVRLGAARDRSEAFRTLLDPGMPGYVHRHAPSLTAAIEVVRAAGGAPVLAHPWGRGGRTVLDPEGLAELRRLGLVGIEVDHQDHDPGAREHLRALARDLDLVVTGSSDYHGLGKVDHELGVNSTAPAELERLLDRAATLAAASGRPVPGLVGPAVG